MKRLLSAGKWRRGIIGGALLVFALLSGCSALKLGYRQGPTLAHWWLDGYLDFDDAQSQRVKDELRRWFDWHQRSQVALYAAHLARARQEAQQDLGPEQLCRWGDSTRDLLVPALERLIPAAAEVLPTLTDAQLQHLDARFAKQTAELHETMLQPDRDARARASVERTLKRFESAYGSLDASQRALIEASVKTSPFQVEAWLEQRQRRHRELMDTLRSLTRDRLPAAQVQERLRQLARRYDGRSPMAPPQEAAALTAYNCALAARVHASTTPDQRRHLTDKLRGWEADLRALLPMPAGVAQVAPAADRSP